VWHLRGLRETISDVREESLQVLQDVEGIYFKQSHLGGNQLGLKWQQVGLTLAEESLVVLDRLQTVLLDLIVERLDTGCP